MLKSHLHYGKSIDISESLVAYFSMGCFWRTEPLFWKVEGVVFTEVGYADCLVENPSCEDIFKNVSHREVVKVHYNKNTNFEKLLDIFFNNHTIDKRDDFPVPDLYRSMVYIEDDIYLNVYQEYLEELIKKRINEGNSYPISTKIKKIENYKIAENHHQQYNLRTK